MRTDSTNIAPEAIEQARQYIGGLGDTYLPEKANVYSSANKDAQEAHEAIRPTSVERTPEAMASALTPDQLKLYDLIWRRFVAGQMVPARWMPPRCCSSARTRRPAPCSRPRVECSHLMASIK